MSSCIATLSWSSVHAFENLRISEKELVKSVGGGGVNFIEKEEEGGG